MFFYDSNEFWTAMQILSAIIVFLFPICLLAGKWMRGESTPNKKTITMMLIAIVWIFFVTFHVFGLKTMTVLLAIVLFCLGVAYTLTRPEDGRIN